MSSETHSFNWIENAIYSLPWFSSDHSLHSWYTFTKMSSYHTERFNITLNIDNRPHYSTALNENAAYKCLCSEPVSLRSFFKGSSLSSLPFSSVFLLSYPYSQCRYLNGSTWVAQVGEDALWLTPVSPCCLKRCLWTSRDLLVPAASQGAAWDCCTCWSVWGLLSDSRVGLMNPLIFFSPLWRRPSFLWLALVWFLFFSAHRDSRGLRFWKPGLPLFVSFKINSFLDLFIYFCVRVFGLHVCMSITRVPDGCLDALELELQEVVTYCVGTGNWIPGLCQNKCA